MTLAFATRLLILTLAWLLGAEVTRRVTVDRRDAVQRLLVSLCGVIAIAAIIAAGRAETRLSAVLGIVAVALATTHAVAAWFFTRPEPRNPTPSAPAPAPEPAPK